MRLKANFRTFLPRVKLRGMGEMSESVFSLSFALPAHVLDFRNVVPFRNQSASKATGSKIEAKFRTSGQNSSDNLTSYLQTIIIAQMLSIGGEGDSTWSDMTPVDIIVQRREKWLSASAVDHTVVADRTMRLPASFSLSMVTIHKYYFRTSMSIANLHRPTNPLLMNFTSVEWSAALSYGMWHMGLHTDNVAELLLLLLFLLLYVTTISG